ncbi:MAG: GNAT family N-acetyltransferase [Acidobacteriota bacterium]
MSASTSKSSTAPIRETPSTPRPRRSVSPRPDIKPRAVRASITLNDPAVKLPGPLPEGFRLRRARLSDVPEIVDLMMKQAHAGGGRLGDLGERFNHHLHEHFVTSQWGLSVVVEAPDGRVAANGTGLISSRPFFTDFLLRRGLKACWAAAPYALRWRNLETVWGALRYIPQSPTEDPKAELVVMNTHGDFHRLGLATQIFHYLMDEYRPMGVPCVKLGHIPVDNARAIAYWESFGPRFIRIEPLYKGHEARVYFYDIPEHSMLQPA